MTPIHKLGKNAHGKTTSSGFYAISPAGHIVLVQSLKPGWRHATDAEIKASEDLEASRAGAERTDDDAKVEAERAASHERGEAERAIADENAARYADKADQRARNGRVLAHDSIPLELVERDGAGDEHPITIHDTATAPVETPSSTPATPASSTSGEG